VKRLQIDTYGKARDVVRLVECDQPEPGPDQVLVAMEASPINPSDLLLIQGWYGHRPQLPAGIGTEGVGRIVAVGSAVREQRIGHRVLVVPNLKQSTWQDRVVVHDDDAISVDASADIHQMAMLGVNPITADLLLRSFVDLAPGAWVAQTGGTSAVAGYVIALAKRSGLRTLNVVRRPEAIDGLLEAGADAVVVSDRDLRPQLKEALGGERISLLLDATAGAPVTDIGPWLGHGATVVSYGGISGGTVALNPSDIIFRNLHVHGFWQKHWLDVTTPEEIARTYTRLQTLVVDGTLQTPVAATYPIADHQTALAHAARSGRSGKVLFSWQSHE